MINIILLLMTVTAFTGYEKNFEQNLTFYQFYLGNDDELTDLGYFHLKALRYLIDLRIDDFAAVNKDCTEMFELMDKDDYLYDMFFERYMPEFVH